MIRTKVTVQFSLRDSGFPGLLVPKTLMAEYDFGPSEDLPVLKEGEGG